MQIFAHGKGRFYYLVEFHVIHLQDKGVKI